MSGPIFVLDGHAQQPLMPIAEAHARKLLSRRKAQWWPHPTLSVIQLTHAVQQPTLRAVLIGVVVHPQTVELFVVVDGVRRALPLLYVLVDVAHRRRRWQWQRRKRRRRRAGGRAVGLMLDICATIGALWRFLPLSHVVIVPTDTLLRDYPGLARQFKQYISGEEIHASIAPHAAPVPDRIPPTLYQALQAFMREPTVQAPQIIAMPMDPIDRQTRLWQMHTRHTESVDVPGIGIIDGLTGILDMDFDSSDDLPLLLSLPVAANIGRVRWVTVRISSTKHLQSWPASIVALLPLASLEGRSDVEILEYVVFDNINGSHPLRF